MGFYQQTVTKGTKVVQITANESTGPFTSRLYVNGGETVTQMVRTAKTLKGAEKAAERLLSLW